MNDLRQFLGIPVDIEISGDKHLSGTLIDTGQDIVIIHDEFHYVYIPFLHIQHIKQSTDPSAAAAIPATEQPIGGENEISYRKTLSNARGKFVEIYVAGNQSIHGYVTSVLTNFFVFYSPVYKTMYIPLNHLKWLIPYHTNQTPYSLEKQFLPVHPSDISLARTFEDQLKKLTGSIVVFDLGGSANKIGLLKKVGNSIAEMIAADGTALYCNIQHVKSVHSPFLQ